jgi:crotonobetaine/carnitine-CoA ligase
VNIVGNRTIRRALEHKARALPDKPFLIFEDRDGSVRRWTYSELDREVNRAAHALLRAGVRPGDKLNLHLYNVPEFIFFWFGAAKMGAVVVPTNTNSVPDELEYILNHSESVLAVTEASLADPIEAVRDRCPGLRQVVLCRSPEAREGFTPLEDFLAGAPDTPPEHTPEPLDEVSMMYTSGTTAKPKGVLITNANYIYVGETVGKGERLGPDDRQLVVLPLFHVNAQYYSTMTALVAGASLALMERFSASRYFDQAIRHNATVGSLFAAPMRMILAQPRRPELRSTPLRLVIFAQNVTEAQLEEWDERFNAPLMQIYGMTETVGLPTMNPLDYTRKNMSIGTAALGYECRVVDEHGADVPPGVEGQLLVRGEPGWTLMKGYYKNPGATADAIRDGWLWTGDVVRMDPEGYFYFVDRAKDMIKRGGENVAAGEVEAVVKAHPAVFDCVVIGVPDPVRDEAIKAFVILKEGEAATAEEIVEWCRPRLSKFRVPEFVEFRDSFPRTSVGKIQKHILRREEAEKCAEQGVGSRRVSG